ncbi:MAG: STAS domain-containing protein [Planctomycetota bacterium]
MDNFKVKAMKLADDIVVFALFGKLDAFTVPELEKTIQQYMDAQIYRYIFDLSKLTGITSAGMGFFTKLNGITADKQGCIVILRPVMGVKETLDVFGLFRLLPLADDLDAALEKIGKTKTG